MISYLKTKELTQQQLFELYEDVGWTAYTKDIEQLQQAVQHSLSVITAWKKNELVGLIRVIGDGLTIIYIQDLLVKKEVQNQGIGFELMQQILLEYQTVRQIVLLTEEAPSIRHFYEKCGFTSADKGDTVAFINLS